MPGVDVNAQSPGEGQTYTLLATLQPSPRFGPKGGRLVIRHVTNAHIELGDNVESAVTHTVIDSPWRW